MTKKALKTKEIEEALLKLWESDLGKAVMIHLRDHGRPSKRTLKKFDMVEEKIDQMEDKFMKADMFKWIIGTMVAVAMTVIGAQWALMNNYFDIFNKNLTEKIQVNTEDIAEIREVLSTIEFVNLTVSN